MTATLTPPPDRPAAPPDGGNRAAPNSALRGVLLLVGTVLLIGILVLHGQSISTAAQYQDGSGQYTVDEQISELTVRAEGTNVVVRQGTGDQTTIDYVQGNPDQRVDYEVRDGVLTVEVDTRFRPRIGPFGYRGSRVEITLPRDGSETTDLDLRTQAGQIRVDGDYGEVQVRSQAGSSELRGSAGSVLIEARAGNITAEDFATTGDVTVHSQAGNVRFATTDVPSSVTINTQSGNITFEVPAGEYDVYTDTRAGNVNDGLSSTRGASTVFEFNAMAGNITLTEGR